MQGSVTKSIEDLVKKQKKQFQKGFTLIELLVIIGIITIMTSVLFVMMTNDKDRRLVRTAAESFVASVRDAQNISLTGQSIGGKRPCSVYVSMSANDFSYTVDAYNPDGSEIGGQPRSCGNSASVESVEVRSESTGRVSITSSSGSLKPITFAVPFGSIDQSAFAGGAWSDYVFSLSGHDYRVCLYRSGRVEAVGFSGTCN